MHEDEVVASTEDGKDWNELACEEEIPMELVGLPTTGGEDVKLANVLEGKEAGDAAEELGMRVSLEAKVVGRKTPL